MKTVQNDPTYTEETGEKKCVALRSALRASFAQTVIEWVIVLQTNIAIQFLHSNFPRPPSLRFSTWRGLEVAFHAISPGPVLVLPLYAGPPVRLLHPCCPRLVNSMVAGVKLHSRGWVLLSDHFALVYTVLDEFGSRHFEARVGHSTLPMKYRSDQ